MYGVVQFGHSVQYDALSLHHCTLQQTELLVLQLLGQLSFPTGLISRHIVKRKVGDQNKMQRVTNLMNPCLFHTEAQETVILLYTLKVTNLNTLLLM